MDRGFSMEALYRVAGKSRQAIWMDTKRSCQVEEVEKIIIAKVIEFRKDHPNMGSRVLYHSMQATIGPLEIGINKFEKLLSREKLTIQRFKSWIPKTSDGKGRKVYANLTNGLILNDVNQLFVSDITYYKIRKIFYYIFSIKDVYSQRMLEIFPAESLEAKQLIRCIKNVINLRGRASLSDCIFHSDNGSQYDSNEVTNLLSQTLKMRISRAYSCQENGSCEQSHHIVKNMYLKDKNIDSFESLIKECKKVKYLINNERAVEQLKYLTPVAFENSLSKINLEDRINKQLYDFSAKT